MIIRYLTLLIALWLCTGPMTPLRGADDSSLLITGATGALKESQDAILACDFDRATARLELAERLISAARALSPVDNNELPADPQTIRTRIETGRKETERQHKQIQQFIRKQNWPAAESSLKAARQGSCGGSFTPYEQSIATERAANEYRGSGFWREVGSGVKTSVLWIALPVAAGVVVNDQIQKRK